MQVPGRIHRMIKLGLSFAADVKAEGDDVRVAGRIHQMIILELSIDVTQKVWVMTPLFTLTERPNSD